MWLNVSHLAASLTNFCLLIADCSRVKCLSGLTKLYLFLSNSIGWTGWLRNFNMNVLHQFWSSPHRLVSQPLYNMGCCHICRDHWAFHKTPDMFQWFAKVEWPVFISLACNELKNCFSFATNPAFYCSMFWLISKHKLMWHIYNVISISVSI